MKGEGWPGSKMNVQRRCLDKKLKERQKRNSERRAIAKILDLNNADRWWRDNALFQSPADDSDDEDNDEEAESLYVCRELLCSDIHRAET